MPTKQKTIRKLRAILSADVKGYSLLMADNELETIATLKSYRQKMTFLIQQHQGRVVDSPGDNMLAEFASAVDAVNCGVKIQEDLEESNAVLSENRKMQFRIGINIGDVVQDKDRIYGDGVNVAARIEGLAEPGGICISRGVCDHVRKKLKLGFEYLGEHSVKNIAQPVRVYKVLMEPEHAGEVIGEERPKPKQWRFASVVSAVVLMVVAGAFAVWHFYFKPPPIEPTSIEKMVLPLPDKPSIAVLAFDNLSGNPNQEYFSDGIAENIITTLSKIVELFVIARNSSFTYKGKPVKVQQISRELGVRYILEGSVRKSGDRVRITAQLIDAKTGQHKWAEKYDRDFEDSFEIQDEITMKIVSALRVELTEGDQARVLAKATQNPDVHLKVVQALSLWRKGTKESMVRYGQIAQEIIDADPESPFGYRISAWYHKHLAEEGISPRENIKKAFQLSQRAVSIDDSDGFSYSILGKIYLLMRKYDKAIEYGKRSVELQPNGAEILVAYGSTLNAAGRSDEAIVHLKQAIRLNPFPAYYYYTSLGMCYRQKGQYKDALKEFKKALHRSPDSALPHVLSATTYSLLGRKEEARASAEKALELAPLISVSLIAKKSRYKNQADLELILNAMRKAGFPE